MLITIYDILLITRRYVIANINVDIIIYIISPIVTQSMFAISSLIIVAIIFINIQIIMIEFLWASCV